MCAERLVKKYEKKREKNSQHTYLEYYVCVVATCYLYVRPVVYYMFIYPPWGYLNKTTMQNRNQMRNTFQI